MANATARVNRAHRGVLDSERLSHSWGTVSAKTQLYTGAMVGMNTAGFLAKFDDTVSLRFFGILLEKDGNPFVPTTGAVSGTAGDGTLDVDVKQPAAFELAITSVAITDIGRRVYALDDQTGTLNPGATTFQNQVGIVKDLVYAADRATTVSNLALVTPIYSVAQSPQIQVFGASGAIQLKSSAVVITLGSAAAMTLADPTTGVHDGMEISLTSATAFAHTCVAPSGYNATGTTLTLGGAKGDGFQLIAYAGKWYTKYTRNANIT